MNLQGEQGLLRTVVRDPVHWLAFGFGAGLLPVAPGTWGSLVGLGLFLLLPPLPAVWLVGIVVAACVVGIGICGASSRRLGVHDHPGIVWDEIAGMLLVAATVPRTAAWLAAAFLAFRLFDVWKPWPIRDLDHSVSGGLGIMLDDVVAAVYAALCIGICQRIIAVL
ncbi:MAG: phosphatidylglycerophosphatase A [Gammaproteobacteria bacterium]|nr:phosphatidylglycerophosphatase A [Gammaproteobacteria bacterium]